MAFQLSQIRADICTRLAGAVVLVTLGVACGAPDDSSVDVLDDPGATAPESSADQAALEEPVRAERTEACAGVATTGDEIAFGGHLEYSADGKTDHPWVAVELPDGRIASGAQSGHILIWDPADPNGAVDELAVHLEGAITTRVHEMLSLKDGRVLSYGGGGFFLWDSFDLNAEPQKLEGFSNVKDMAQTTEGLVIIGTRIGAFVWDPEQPIDSRKVYPGHGDNNVSAVAPLADGLVATAGSGAVQIWDPTDLSALVTYREHVTDVNSVIQLCDGRLLSEGRAIHIWHPDNPSAFEGVHGPDGRTHHEPLADGRVATGGHADQVLVWDPADTQRRTVFEYHNREVRQVLQLSDGRVLSLSDDGMIRIWPVTDE